MKIINFFILTLSLNSPIVFGSFTLDFLCFSKHYLNFFFPSAYHLYFFCLIILASTFCVLKVVVIGGILVLFFTVMGLIIMSPL